MHSFTHLLTDFSDGLVNHDRKISSPYPKVSTNAVQEMEIKTEMTLLMSNSSNSLLREIEIKGQKFGRFKTSSAL